MYIQEISIEIRSKEDRERIQDEFDSLMASYRHSGQTQGDIESKYITDGRIICLPFTHEKNALSKKFNNYYVNKRIQIIEDLCNSKFNFKTLGTTYEGYKAPCKCKKPEFYLLNTNYMTISSPLDCGTCDRSIPLYRLPVYDDHGYRPILLWEGNYQACDKLWMHGEVGERWALKQMQEVSSELSKQGLKICRKIEELTSIPTYYYLHNYRKEKGDPLQRLCPGCNGQWALKTPLHREYDFKCDHCKLLSIISPR